MNPFLFGNPAAFGQQTLVGRVTQSQASGRTGGLRSARKRRAKSTAKTAPRARRASSAKRGRARLVKGSAAAKRYMAKIRRMRKR